ncbi:MAG: hypothetical protein AB1403_13045 [Candidatus Riflebacteria bacterium]
MKKGLSLTEIMIAMSIAITVLVPVISMFSSAGRSVQKSTIFNFATGLGRKISQHLLVIPFDEIQEIPLPGISLCDSPDDQFFSPFLNFSNDKTGLKRINQNDLPDLYSFLNLYDFHYALSVSNVSFGSGDEMKSVSILVTWVENGKDMIYQTHAYIPSN